MSTRRRRVVGALAAAALVTTGCGGGPADPTAPEAASSPAPAPPSPNPTLPSAADWVDTLPVGPPPAVGYVIGHTYHSPDGRVVRMPQDWGVTSIVGLGDGYLVTSDHAFEGTTGVFRLDEHGRIDTSAGQHGHLPGAATVTSHPVLGADATSVYWLTFTPPESGLSLPTLLHTGDVGSGEVNTFDVDVDYVALAYVVGVVDEGVVIRAGWAGQGDVLTYDTSSREIIGSPWLRDVGLIHTRSGRATVARGKDGSALGVLDLADREHLWLRRHAYPIAYSPSGRSLLAGSGRRVMVLDARTGAVRRELEPPGYRRGRWSGELGWEDERHVLASVSFRDRAAVVRVDVRTGACELAVDWTPKQDAFYVTFETGY